MIDNLIDSRSWTRNGRYRVGSTIAMKRETRPGRGCNRPAAEEGEAGTT